jgi:RecA/RadA recombinase
VLAQAQRLPEANSIRKIVGDIVSLAQARPEVLDKLDADQAVDELAYIEGVPPKIIVTDDVAAQVRQARAQQQQQMQQMQMLQEAGRQMNEGVKAMGGA